MVLDLLTRKEQRKLIVVLFFMLAGGVMEVIGVGSIMPFISVASDPEIIQSNPILSFMYEYFGFENNHDFIIALGIAVIVFIFLNNLARTGITWIIQHYSGMRLHKMTFRLLKRYLSQPYQFFLNQNSSNLSKNILAEVRVVVNGFLMVGLNLISSFVIIVFLVALLFIVNPILALTTSAVLTLSYILIYNSVRGYLKRKGEERAQVNSLRYKYVSESLGGIKDVKLLGLERDFLHLFEQPSKQYAMNDAITEVISDIPKFAMETLAFGGILTLMLIMISTGSSLAAILPIVTLYAFAGYRLLPALQKVFKSVSKLKYTYPILELIHNDLAKLPEVPDHPPVKPEEKMPFSDTVQLDTITFQYPGTNEDVIKGESFSIKANTTVGLVGTTGCGKTTLVDILLGLLSPDSGSIFVDGVKLDEKNLPNWQINLGYVPQTIFLTDDSIKKNIAFGIPEEKIDFEAVKRAASIANIDQFIEQELEKGYETIVGERGVRLSGGQRQRIGIARALYNDPAVLILDEATSALDGLTEIAIMDAIDNLSHRKTIIMIAHRLTTVKKCDQLVMIEKGRIIDKGTYTELYKSNASFRKMADGNT